MLLLDYRIFYIGSIGFAQLGQLDYNERSIIERQVMLKHCLENFDVPMEFKQDAFFRWERNSHDFGIYYDMVIKYNVQLEEEAESTDDNMEKWERLVDWMQHVESYDWESDEIFEECRLLYQKEYPMNIVHKKQEKEDIDDLMQKID